MRGDVCKCCGQTLPDKLDLGIELPAGYQFMVETIHKAGKHGINAERLFSILYSGPDGGPESGMRCLRVRINHLNRVHLKKINKRVVGERVNAASLYGRYRLVDVV